MRLFILSLILSCLSPLLHGAKLENKTWLEVRSKNFIVQSMVSKNDTLRLLRNLERFRMAALGMTNIQSTQAPIPTKIFAWRGNNFSIFDVGKNVGGFILPGDRRYTMVIGGANKSYGTKVILHEYVHFLLRNSGGFHYPRWFDEGFSDYLAAVKSTDKKFQVGLAAEGRLYTLASLKWRHIKHTIAPKQYHNWSGKKVSMFYAQAWLLVHYLNNQHRDRLNKHMPNYLSDLDKGLDPILAFSKNFDIDIDALDRKLRRYYKKGKFQITQFDAQQLLPDFQPSVRKMSKEEASFGLAELAMERGMWEKANLWLRLAGGDESFAPTVFSNLAVVAAAQEHFDLALTHFDTAASLGLNSAYYHLDIAETWLDYADDQEDKTLKIKAVKKAQRHIVKAWKLDNKLPAIYAAFGRSYLVRGTKPAKAVEMLGEANYLIPFHQAIRLQLARAYIANNDHDEAQELLRSVLAFSHSGSSNAKQAADLLDDLNE